MSKPVFENIFTFSQCRRNRKSFLLFKTCLMLVSVCVTVMVMLLVFPTSDAAGFSAITLALLVLPGVPLMISNLAVSSQRFRDIGISGWWVLLLFVPYINLVMGLFLLFVPGTKGANRFGEDPVGDLLSPTRVERGEFPQETSCR